MQIKHLIYTLLAGVSFSACNLLGPVDDIHPDYVLTDDNVITDANSAEYLLNGIYQYYRQREFASLRSAMFILTGTLLNSDVEGSTNFANNDVRIENNAVLNYYTVLYSIINQANSLIVQLENKRPQGLSDTRKSEILGEAYFHKAFAEVMLLRAFGEFWDQKSEYGIILYNEPVRDNSEAKGRSTVAECYSQILSDLKQAEQAPAYAGMAYKVNKITVNALKARVLLYLNRYAEAAQTAQATIDEALGSGMALESNYLNIFSQGFSSHELLMAPYVSYPQEQIYGSKVTDAAMRGFGTTIKLIAEELDPTGNDPRYTQTYLSTEAGNLLQKYVLNDAATGDNNTYYLMRLAEVYLIKAEAEARNGQYAAARMALKPLTDRAGYAAGYVDTIADNDLLLAIFRHKYLELSAENYEEWYDMVRYSQLDGTDFVSLGYVHSMAHLNLPIPRSALSGNKLLEQNPSYTLN